MTEAKQVKVDNWGIFFLQRLKHFFNRTDYCDLTLQFQDNAQLKVHRLVLSACTEYFELLERTCEMYEDCLVMPDDLQADVVVPIVNFMYTGQLEFRMDLLERLYQTSLVMNMPVLTKLLDAHRSQQISHTYTPKRYSKLFDTPKHYASGSSSNATNNSNKRSYGKAFDNGPSFRKFKKQNSNKSDFETTEMVSTIPLDYQATSIAPKKHILSDPRPTRYELPEELEADNLFDNSFTSLSYTSKPLMVHPETTKHYPSKRTGIFEDPSTSKRFIHGRSTMDIVECKKISTREQTFDEDPSESICDDQDSYPRPMMPVKMESRDSNQLFDQILDGGPKVTIETKDNKQASHLDHARIISEVLKKYPHLVKSNKNIKLKILNTPSKKKPPSKPQNSFENEKVVKQKSKTPDYAYESDVIDSKEAAKLIALGAENIKGPWICLICGAPGKAIHFGSYHKFRRHLIDVHNEKPVLNICEYCGLKSQKRNYLLHHLYTKHGIDPPSSYHFPKCNVCNYIALTEGFLIKHKLTHTEKQTFRCNVCSATFSASNQLLLHIQKTGHKYSADRKGNLQCIYCLKIFLREANLYTHLRTHHKESAKNDGIIDISDEDETESKVHENVPVKPTKQEVIKYEVPVTYETEFEYDADVQYQIQQQPDGNIQVVSKKPRVLLPAMKHKILNAGFSTPSSKIVQQSTLARNTPNKQNEFIHNSNIPNVNESSEEVVMIDNNEYIVRDNQLIPKKERAMGCEDYSMTDIMHTGIEDSAHNIIPSSSAEFTNIHQTNSENHKMMVNKSGNINHPIQIVVSNEEEYKALMSNNHSIIFEDTETSKTLTVLTAPHDNNAPIDLDNAPSNDMMIIPGNYPLNVTETVSGTNSSIVVVYSHPVDDQNKEYQLISSQNLEAQFVTSSAMITQNYETVTTSAPIVNAHVIETSEDSWPNSIPQNMTHDTEMEIPISNNQVTIAPVENEQRSIAHLEEVQLPPVHSGVVQIHSNVNINQTTVNLPITEPHNTNNVAETGTGTSHETQSVYEDSVDSLPTSNLNIDMGNTSVEDIRDTNQTNEDLNYDSEGVQDNIHLENMSVAQEVEAESSPVPQTLGQKYVQNAISETSTESETDENIAKVIQSSVAVPVPAPSDRDTPESDVGDHIDKGEMSLTKAKEQIENLTSEWSDDEIETSSQDQSTSQEVSNLKQATECQPMETKSVLELEEPIENIQQALEKQLTPPIQVLTTPQPVEPSTDTENVTIASQEHKVLETEPDNIEDDLTENNKTPDKITSLLNDWQDNDSQMEDTAGVNENKEEAELVKVENVPTQDIENSINIEVQAESVTKPEAINNKPDIKAGDNIQKLVNDWVEDDEDEEAKVND